MILRPYKKIKELESEIERLERDNRIYKQEEKERNDKEKLGLHDVNISCKGCKNFINTGYALFCKKDCKCKDREEED